MWKHLYIKHHFNFIHVVWQVFKKINLMFWLNLYNCFKLHFCVILWRFAYSVCRKLFYVKSSRVWKVERINLHTTVIEMSNTIDLGTLYVLLVKCYSSNGYQIKTLKLKRYLVWPISPIFNSHRGHFYFKMYFNQ